MTEMPPDGARLERLLYEAFEFAPGPDMRRLGEIEERLERALRAPASRPARGAPWWAVLLIAGGAAAAAWWAGSPADKKGPHREAPAPREIIRPAEPAHAAQPAAPGTGEAGDRHIIDRREPGQ